MFAIGDVLFIQDTNCYKRDSIVIIINITYGTCNEKRSTELVCDGIFYHVKVLEGDYYVWFMDDSPIANHCALMVSNFNDEEKLAMVL